MGVYDRVILTTAILGVILVSAAPAAAQTGGGYDLTWVSIDSGAGTIAGGGYTLTGSIGQPDAAPALTGGGYSLSGGVLAGANDDPRADVSAWALY